MTTKQGFCIPAVERHVEEIWVASGARAQDSLQPARQEVLAEGPDCLPLPPTGPEGTLWKHGWQTSPGSRPADRTNPRPGTGGDGAADGASGPNTREQQRVAQGIPVPPPISETERVSSWVCLAVLSLQGSALGALDPGTWTAGRVSRLRAAGFPFDCFWVQLSASHLVVRHQNS